MLEATAVVIIIVIVTAVIIMEKRCLEKNRISELDGKFFFLNFSCL